MHIGKRKIFCLLLAICLLFGGTAQAHAATRKYSLENKKAASYLKKVKYDQGNGDSKIY